MDSVLPAVTLVIPVYNDEATLGACLRSVFKHTDYPDWRVIVVDDGSTDRSIESIAEFKNVQILRQPRGGVAKALNVGFLAAGRRDVVRLHADAVIETPGWLALLVETACTQPKAGIVGARLVYPDGRIYAEGRSLLSGFGFHPRHKNRRAFQNESVGGKIVEVDGVPGALAYYRREVLDRVGGLDESFGPAWCEDDDYCISARHKGFKVYVQPAVRAVHYTRGESPTYRCFFPGSEGTLNQMIGKLKSVAERIQGEVWEKKWGWHPFYPDINEIRRLYGETEICWQIGERLRYHPGEQWPTVDCCLATWNTLPLLRRMMESLAKTDYPADKLTVYIANNGSTDGTEAYLAELSRNHPFRVVAINLAVNTGVAPGLNFALNAGTGELVARLDDDIILPTNWLKMLARDFSLRPFAGCIGSKTISDDDRGGIQWACPHLYPVGYTNRDEPDAGQADFLARVIHIHGCCNLYRREALVNCGLIDIRYSPSQYDDIDHHIVLMHAGYEVIFDGRVSVVHKINNGLDRSILGMSSTVANGSKMFGKWGRDVFEVLDGAILLSREGRYLPDDGDTSEWVSAGPSSTEFPRQTAGVSNPRLLEKIYEQLSARMDPESELGRLCDQHLALAEIRRVEGNLLEATDVVLAVVNFAPLWPHSYAPLSALCSESGVVASAQAAARRGLHLAPGDAKLEVLAGETRQTLRRREENQVLQLRAAHSKRSLPGLDVPRVLLVGPFRTGAADNHGEAMRSLSEQLIARGIAADVTHFLRPEVQGYDLAHVWGSEFSSQTLSQIKAIRAQAPKLPIVYTPLYSNPREALWMESALKSIFSKNAQNAQIDQSLANILTGKFLVNGEFRPTTDKGTFYQNTDDLLRSRPVELVDCLVTGTQGEFDAMGRPSRRGMKHVTIPHARSTAFLAGATPELFEKKYGLKDFVLIISPLEPSENQLLLLYALQPAGIPVVIIGRQVDPVYTSLCRKYANVGSLFVESLSPEMLASAYKACALFVSPAFSKATSPSCFEAAAAGCRLVISSRLLEAEYFKGQATFFDPANVGSIRAALQNAAAAPQDSKSRQSWCHALEKTHTASRAFELTLDVYCELLNAEKLGVPGEINNQVAVGATTV